jgi:hypothetical protein
MGRRTAVYALKCAHHVRRYCGALLLHRTNHPGREKRPPLLKIRRGANSQCSAIRGPCFDRLSMTYPQLGVGCAYAR